MYAILGHEPSADLSDTDNPISEIWLRNIAKYSDEDQAILIERKSLFNRLAYKSFDPDPKSSLSGKDQYSKFVENIIKTTLEHA